MTKLLGLAGGAFAYLGATASVALARTPAQGGSGDQGNVREEVTGGVQAASEAGVEMLRRGGCASLVGGSSYTRGVSESWQVDSIRSSAFITARVTYQTRRGPRTQTFRSVRSC